MELPMEMAPAVRWVAFQQPSTSVEAIRAASSGGIGRGEHTHPHMKISLALRRQGRAGQGTQHSSGVQSLHKHSHGQGQDSCAEQVHMQLHGSGQRQRQVLTVGQGCHHLSKVVQHAVGPGGAQVAQVFPAGRQGRQGRQARLLMHAAEGQAWGFGEGTGSWPGAGSGAAGLTSETE